MLFDVFNSLIVDIELLSYKISRSVSLTPQSVVYKHKCKVQELVSPLWVVFLHLPHCAVLSIFFLVKKTCGNKETVFTVITITIEGMRGRSKIDPRRFF